MSRIEEEPEKTINWLQKEIDRSSRDEPGKQEMRRELEKKQRELEQIIEHKTKGAILRSKLNFISVFISVLFVVADDITRKEKNTK